MREFIKPSVEFTDTLISEGSWGSRELGLARSEMTLKNCQNGIDIYIEWEAFYLNKDGSDNDDIESEYEVIDIELSDNNPFVVIGYEGLMGIPIQAVQLLRDNNFDVSEIEY